MSNAERKKGKFKIIIILAVAVALVLLTVSFAQVFGREKPYPREEKDKGIAANLPFESIKIEYTKGNEISFSMKLQKEEMKSFLKEKRVDIPFIFALLPEKLEASGDAKIHIFSADGYVSLQLLKMSINGFDIPQKLLSDIGELKLDFKRSLVYN